MRKQKQRKSPWNPDNWTPEERARMEAYDKAIEECLVRVKTKLIDAFNDAGMHAALYLYAPSHITKQLYLRHLKWLERTSIDDIAKWLDDPGFEFPAERHNHKILERLQDQTFKLMIWASDIIQTFVDASEKSPAYRFSADSITDMKEWQGGFQRNKAALDHIIGKDIATIDDKALFDRIEPEDFIK